MYMYYQKKHLLYVYFQDDKCIAFDFTSGNQCFIHTEKYDADKLLSGSGVSHYVREKCEVTGSPERKFIFLYGYELVLDVCLYYIDLMLQILQGEQVLSTHQGADL